jgi:FMN-dependent NADH-azoreductase
MKLLHIDSSISGEASASRQLSSEIVRALTEATPGVEVIRRDLHANPLPHLDNALLPAIRPDPASDPATRPTDEKGAAALDEFLSADIVVIGTPMYNFTVPTQLKAWIDRIAIAGKTFSYSEAGPKGLAGGKKVIIASSRGGLYAPGMPFAANDFQEPYLRAIFRFLGIEDIEVVRAEGIAYGPEQREAAIKAALASINPVVSRVAPERIAMAV